MGGEPGAGLVFVPAVALVLAYPVPHGAVREASVGLLLPRQASSSHNQSSLVLVSDCETSAATL